MVSYILDCYVDALHYSIFEITGFGALINLVYYILCCILRMGKKGVRISLSIYCILRTVKKWIRISYPCIAQIGRAMLWIFMVACGSNEKGVSSEICLDTGLSDGASVEVDIDSGDIEDEIDSPEDTQWDDAVLRILSPTPNQVLPLGEPVAFEAIIENQLGETLLFDEIEWATDVDSSWSHDGSSFTDDALPAGNHVLSVNSHLPNGDRLGYAIGGLLVQHPDAGIYAGTMSINVVVTSWDGTEIPVNCAGAATVTVSMEGETATGSSTCLLTIFEQQLETVTNFEIDQSEGLLTGLAIADLVLIGWNFDLTGTLQNGELQASWSDNVFGIGQIDGSMDLVRVSLY